VLEHKPVLFTVLALIAILIGGIIEMVPTFLVRSNIPTISSVKPYSPLELHGRDIYIREGCVNCHSQMIRPFRSETERYGEYSKSGEYVYDHPFLWGSKRTGPDLHRLGGKYSNTWHYNHMLAPDAVSTGSIMPGYPWLFEQTIDLDATSGKIKALRTVGVPYEEGFEDVANEALQQQADAIVNSLKADGIEVASEAEIVALIAYLQRLGTDIKSEKTASVQLK
jgi:cytochrome c oxidase cbb3-type subunit I/II